MRVSCEEDDEVERVEKGRRDEVRVLVAIKCWSMRSSLAVVENKR